MKVVGLFAGIGGLELGFGRAGLHSSLLCEIDPFALAVLEDRFPEAEKHLDIRRLSDLPSDVDVICAGFPCQDLSQAGKTVGIAGSRSGLIGEVFRLLARRKVRWLILENVPFMLQLQGGGAMRAIVAELEELGYRWAYRVVNSMAFGLPQRRERVYLVATAEGDPGSVLFADEADYQLPATDIGRIAHGFYWTEGIRGLGWAPDAIPTLKNGSTLGIPSPPAVLMPNGSVIKPDIRDAERLQGFPSDWTRPAEAIGRASQRWTLVGNAVSVPAAEWLGSRVAKPGNWDRGRMGEPVGGKWPRAAMSTAKGPVRVAISSFPVAEPRPHLHEFLRYEGAALSQKATAGFLSRTDRSSLNFPDGFLSMVRSHLLQVSRSGGGYPVAQAAE